MEWVFRAVYPLLGRVTRMVVSQEKEMFFPLSGKNCDINYPVKWKVFSTCLNIQLPIQGYIMGNPLGFSLSTFGIPIAK